MALYWRVRNCNEPALAAVLSQFVRLEQDVLTFKMAVYEFKTFNKTVGSSLEVQAPEARPRPTKTRRAQPRSQINISFWDHSRRMFESLATLLQRCPSRDSNHKVMLQLKDLEHPEGPSHSPKLCMLLSACPDGDSWQQAHCSMLLGACQE